MYLFLFFLLFCLLVHMCAMVYLQYVFDSKITISVNLSVKLT